MKKLIFGLSIVVGIALLSISTYFIIDTNGNQKEIHNESKAKPNKPKEETEVLDEVEQEHGYKLYRPEQTVKVDGAKNGLTINKGSDEAAVIQDMHEMTHQKVQAEGKKGAIEMTSTHVDTVYSIVKDSDFTHKAKLLEILTRWKKSDFSKIVDDHNDLWTIQGGKTGEATGRLTTREEKEFIVNNFGK